MSYALITPTVVLVTGFACLVAGCAGQQQYASSLASAQLPDRSYVTSRKTTCGDDKHVCWEMNRDDKDRRAVGSQ